MAMHSDLLPMSPVRIVTYHPGSDQVWTPAFAGVTSLFLQQPYAAANPAL